MGYDTDRFDKDPNPEFVCSICHDVFEDPVMIDPCEHVYCRACIDQWKHDGSRICPAERGPINGYKPIQRVFVNALDCLRIHCRFHAGDDGHGCPAVVRLADINDHELHCRFNPESLSTCEGGCGLELKQSEVSSHNCVTYLVEKLKATDEELKKYKEKYGSLSETATAVGCRRCASFELLGDGDGEAPQTPKAPKLSHPNSVASSGFRFSTRLDAKQVNMGGFGSISSSGNYPSFNASGTQASSGFRFSPSATFTPPVPGMFGSPQLSGGFGALALPSGVTPGPSFSFVTSAPAAAPSAPPFTNSRTTFFFSGPPSPSPNSLPPPTSPFSFGFSQPSILQSPAANPPVAQTQCTSVKNVNRGVADQITKYISEELTLFGPQQAVGFRPQLVQKIESKMKTLYPHPLYFMDPAAYGGAASLTWQAHIRHFNEPQEFLVVPTTCQARIDIKVLQGFGYDITIWC